MTHETNQHDRTTALGEEPPEPRGRLVAVARRGRWALLAAAILGAAVGLLAAHGRAHSYEATATILVGPAAGEDKTVQAASQLAESWAALATSRPLLDATARTLRLPPLTDALTAKANESTRLVTITARNGRPDLAARIANTQAAAVKRLAPPQAAPAPPRGAGKPARVAPAKPEDVAPGQLAIVEPAVVPTAPAGPPAAAFGGAGALLAAGGAFALLLLLAGARDPVRDAEHVRALTDGEPVALLSPHAGDQALLGAPAATLGPRSMLLVGTGDVDVAAVGRSLVAALAGRGSRAALVSAIADDADAAAAEEADVVVVHSPPLELFPAALGWSRRVEATFVVAGVDRTRGADLAAAVGRLRLVGATLAGTLLVERRRVRRRLSV